MATVDLTGKLGLAEKPTIAIGDIELTVDNSARSVLRLMQAVGGGDVQPAQVLDAMEIIFSEDDLAKVDSLSLSFADLTILLQTAMDLVAGAAEGEAATLDTTS